MRPTKKIRLGRLLPHQRELIYSQAFRRAFIGGVGSGKSWTAVHLALRAAVLAPGVPGALLNATYPLLRDTTLDEWFRNVPSDAYEWRAAEHVLRLWNGTDIKCRSTDKAKDRIRGWNLGWAVYDECGIAKDATAAKMLTQRLRAGPPHLRFLALVSSPAGYPWLQEWVEKDYATGPVHLINATTYDNPHTGRQYKLELEQEFPEGSLEHEQEMLGRFISRTGLLYGDSFYEDRHVVPMGVDDEKPYYLGWDPGARVAGVVAVQELLPEMWVVVREWLPTNEPTEDTAYQIIDDMGRRPVEVYLDTPSKQNTRSDLGDLKALRAIFGRRTNVRVTATKKRATKYRHQTVRTALNRGALLFSRSLVHPNSGGDDRGIIKAMRTMPYLREELADESVDRKDPRKHVIDALEFFAVHCIPPKFATSRDRRQMMDELDEAA